MARLERYFRTVHSTEFRTRPRQNWELLEELRQIDDLWEKSKTIVRIARAGVASARSCCRTVSSWTVGVSILTYVARARRVRISLTLSRMQRQVTRLVAVPQNARSQSWIRKAISSLLTPPAPPEIQIKERENLKSKLERFHGQLVVSDNSHRCVLQINLTGLECYW